MMIVSHRLRSGGPYVVVRGPRKRDYPVTTDIVRDLSSFSLAERLHAKFVAYLSADRLLYVAPGAIVHPPFELLEETSDWDVAAFVDSIGARPEKPTAFSGIGRVRLETLAFRRTPDAGRVLARWVERAGSGTAPDPAVALAIALRECSGAKLLHLPPEYAWNASLRPAFGSSVRIEHRYQGEPPQTVQAPPKAIRTESDPEVGRRPECLWVGHLYQYTGYGKANREILFRIANTVTVRIDDAHKEPNYVSRDLQVRLDAHKQVLVGPRAPLLRLMGPDYVTAPKRHRIVWTMQESSRRVHADMAKRANENFDELWTPTQWNLDVFRSSGVRLPMRVMRLGINPLVFNPQVKRKPLPPCKLISTSRRGLVGVPSGFTFLTVGLPGFRKGWDVLADAAELAFAGRRNVALVIGLTHSPKAWNEKVYKQFAGYKVPIWTFEGSFDEFQLAGIYASVGAYVSASRGEGFNLPALEAAACGTRVVVPENTCHPELFDGAWMFRPDGEQTYPEGDWISDWYKGMLFSRFGKPSIRALAEILKTLSENSSRDSYVASTLSSRILNSLTWDFAADAVVERLLEVQP